MASSSSLSSSFTAKSKYDVFLSFLGKDTGIGIRDHLAAALRRKQIELFIDDEQEPQKGDEISPAVSKAIETSAVSIIIFSENYAYSTWCLDELVRILDCKKRNGQTVVPVFYKVSPPAVRKQRLSFGEAFVHHESNFSDKVQVQKWRDSLTQASNISGFYASRSFRNDAELVEKIAEDISKKLKDMADPPNFPSSMASSSCLSSSFTAKCKYDVFLSFGGEETRTGIGSHLAAALRRKQIELFIDDEKEANKGDEISPAVSDAIETSLILIVIFSKDYASSKWCLDELVKILDCLIKNTGQIVVPVFYRIDSSDVHKQKGSFRKAFVHHERNFPDKVQKWREALTKASSISEFFVVDPRNEAGDVEKIAQDISKKVEEMSDSPDLSGFVGLNLQIEKIKSLLCLELGDVRIVGIWGMGGIGKTTIASVIFHQISGDFQGKCFMKNVGEESSKMGVIHVRDEVISQVMGENIKIGTPTITPNIKKRLQQRKVLIVLDDVDDNSKSFAVCLDLFSPGSRIIITTRDKRLLYKRGVQSVCEVKGLKHNSALELFCRKAFRQNNRSPDLLELSEEVAHYANGNPLALQVLGSSLYQKSKEQWKDKLHKLKLITDPNIYKVLKISYDGLNWEEKEIFLDVACFFKGEDVDFVTRVQDDPTSMRNGLNILVEKSLITISDNRLQMHDMLQEIGKTIIRQESFKEPGKRSKLWDHKDVYQVLKKNKGTDAIEGIFFDLSKINYLHLSPHAFANMSSLTLLKFYMPECNGVPVMSSKLHLDQDLEYLSKKLRYLHWHEYPLKTLPFSFKPKCLIELNLPYSKVEQIWIGEKKAFKLKFINLYNTRYLTKLPEFSEIPNLERINLSGSNLERLPATIKQFSQLRYLYLRNCNMLQSLPELPLFLSHLDASNCKRLESLPEISPCLEELDISILEKLSKTTFPMKHDCSLMQFEFQNCSELNEDKILADSELRIQRMAIASLRLFYEKEQLYCPSILLPGSEIPKWFTCQDIGPLIALHLPEHCLINLIGVALCAVIDFKHLPPNSWDSFYISCGIHIKMNKHEDFSFSCSLASIRDAIDSDHVILGFSPLRIGGFPVGGGNHNTTVVVDFFPAKVKCCGVSPVYADPNKTEPKTFTLKFAAEIGKLDDKARKIESK
ncbi:ADP-ribosyl cyclase/cyclic ADP-ribose hydrolase [Citrus sinensis]|uniref:disease resistance-like protein DSC1 isoform X1 n=1 Tax=Citrus sinensis TaxID=2711 RepID=UPI00218E2FFA|nr:disease resistance-like protein DSC1 isoform X1 [Citrus sinensis]KAH9727760.1 ADP-ribosyl cyclase/cyclic ADP-ribose hydrolase [Citrus sinensis]